MKPEHLEVLSALFDGERVDPALLAEALADHRAADVLADFAGLRVLSRAEAPDPSDAFYARMAPLLRRTGLRHRLARFFPPAVAAALLLAAGVTGFMLRPVVGPFAPTTAPPLITPLQTAPAAVTAAPLPSAAAVPTTRTQPGPDANAPPASALRVRFVHWQETAAGFGHSRE
jgi:hypothetical protein